MTGRAAFLARAAVLVVVFAAGSGCATYSERLASARTAVDAGNTGAAIEQVSAALGVDPDELPSKSDANTTLGLLERGSLLQAAGRIQDSARDWTTADKDLEVLDLRSDPVGTLGSYLFSDELKTYRLLPSEQLALNTLNMVNFLAQGDLEGARVEARRFVVSRDYLKDTEDAQAQLAAGSYLAGFVFEHLGEANEAIRFYDDALGARRFQSLGPSLARLARLTSYRGRHIDAALAATDAQPPPDGHGDLLVVMPLGRVPHRVPKRMPLGAAIGLAGAFITGDARILERSVFKVVVYPELNPATARRRDARVQVAGVQAPVEVATDLGSAVSVEYEDLKPQIIGAALTRMITRAAVAEGTRAGVRQASGSGIAGLLAAWAIEGVMVGLDKPDTRSWTFLPGRVLISRLRLPAGRHEVSITVEGLTGASYRVPVDLAPGGWAVVNVTELR